MRYSVDVAGVAKVSSDVAVHFASVAESVAQTLTAVDSAASALTADASGVEEALESAMETRRLTGPGLSARAADILSGVQAASVAYVEGDDEMAIQTTSAVPEPLPGRGFGAVPQ